MSLVMKSVLANTIQVLLICLLLRYLFPKIKKFGFNRLIEIYSPSSWAILYVIVSVLSTFTSAIWNGISRYQKTQADLEALLLTKDVKSFISTEIKMAHDNCSLLNLHPFIVWYSHSHPKTIDRIRLAENFQDK